MSSRRTAAAVIIGTVALGAVVVAQSRIASPAGIAATEIRGKYNSAPEPEYEGGQWIEVTYGRPIKRGRNLWGSGASYGEMLNAGAPVWRAGANVSTRLKTGLPLVIGGKTVAAGEYSLFIDLKPNSWTFIVSSWPAQTTYNPQNTAALWGSFGYTPARDIARAPMTLGTLPVSIDQLTWGFADMSDAGGRLTIMWDKTIASVGFTVAR
jgi:Protein of unknown function (DUF2911)